MSGRVIRFGERGGNYGRKSDAMEFEEAAQMVEEGLECMRELAEEMKDQYGERRYGMRGGYGMRGVYGNRGGYGGRGGYGEREDWDDMEDMYGMRRRRDRMGRFM